MAAMKTKQPPQILPKPPGSVCNPAKVTVPQPASSPQITIPAQQQQTILLNHQVQNDQLLYMLANVWEFRSVGVHAPDGIQD